MSDATKPAGSMDAFKRVCMLCGKDEVHIPMLFPICSKCRTKLEAEGFSVSLTQEAPKDDPSVEFTFRGHVDEWNKLFPLLLLKEGESCVGTVNCNGQSIERLASTSRPNTLRDFLDAADRLLLASNRMSDGSLEFNYGGEKSKDRVVYLSRNDVRKFAELLFKHFV